jgi:hypothetical protein
MLRSLLPVKVVVLVVSMFEEAKLFPRRFGNEMVRPACCKEYTRRETVRLSNGLGARTERFGV